MKNAATAGRLVDTMGHQGGDFIISAPEKILVL